MLSLGNHALKQCKECSNETIHGYNGVYTNSPLKLKVYYTHSSARKKKHLIVWGFVNKSASCRLAGVHAKESKRDGDAGTSDKVHQYCLALHKILYCQLLNNTWLSKCIVVRAKRSMLMSPRRHRHHMISIVVSVKVGYVPQQSSWKQFPTY